jgi:hypothetical protein
MPRKPAAAQALPSTKMAKVIMRPAKPRSQILSCLTSWHKLTRAKVLELAS